MTKHELKELRADIETAWNFSSSCLYQKHCHHADASEMRIEISRWIINHCLDRCLSDHMHKMNPVIRLNKLIKMMEENKQPKQEAQP